MSSCNHLQHITILTLLSKHCHNSALDHKQSPGVIMRFSLIVNWRLEYTTVPRFYFGACSAHNDLKFNNHIKL